MLNMKKVELEHIPDLEMYFSLKKIWQAEFLTFLKYRYRYSQASNKYLKSYDPKQESKHIMSLDLNTLYGYAMLKSLPASEFRWIDPKNVDSNKYSSNSFKRCISEVDFEYP